MLSVRFLPWLMWGVTTLFFAYQFIMRLAPGLLMPELMQKFNIDATAYGLFAAIYYFVYAGMQIPVALLLDRFGPRIVITICILACSVGTLLLCTTNHWGLLLFGRCLIGAGSAAGFLGSSKIITVWFPEKLYTKMIGFTFTFGLLGAVYGGKPIGLLIAKFGWVDVLIHVGLVGLVISILVAGLVRNSSTSTPIPVHCTDKISTIFKNLKAIVCNKHLLLIALANFLMVGSLEGFADVWGVPYLVTTRGMLKENAAQIVSLIYVGMLFGGPILVYCADKLRSRYWVASATGLFMGLIFVSIFSFNIQLDTNMLYVLLFIIGILCCYQVLMFSIGTSLVPKASANLAVAFLNSINMFGGSFFHSTIGYCMDFFWDGSIENGVRIYDTHAYTYALSLIAIMAVLGSIIILIAVPKKKINFLRNTAEGI